MEFFISDLHLFHENCLKFDQRPFESVEELHETIINNWNEKVTNADTVYIIGDIAMKAGNEELIKLVSTLKGHKVLVKGNHDRVKDYRYQQLFQEIVDYKEIQVTITNDGKKENVKLVLCHYPILMWKNQHRGDIHLYGHVHNSIEETIFQNAIDTLNKSIGERKKDDKEVKAYNVGCMMPWMNYTPRTLEEIISGYEELKRINYRS